MRFTVGRKIVAGLTLILAIGSLSMVMIYRGLETLRESIRDLAERREPSSASAYEMEINVNGMGLAVLKYLDFAEPGYRTRVEEDRRDFVRFNERYRRLVRTPEERALGDSVGRLFEAFHALAERLMDRKDQQEARFAEVAQRFEAIDELLDGRLQLGLDPENPDQLGKLARVNELEADVAEVAFWLANYHRSPRPEHRTSILDNEAELRRGLEAFLRLDLTPEERRAAERLEELLDETTSAVGEIVALQDELREGTEALVGSRAGIDRLLDREIQMRALEGLYEPRRQADRETEAEIALVRVLLPVYVLSALGVAFLLIRGIMGPIGKLERGTQAIGRGELEHRIAIAGDDELAELGRRFNEMVERLQATTVSKQLLEESERKLQATVASLRREIAERVRAQEEQARLEVSLRRSETMAAMGSLVAGVAHEVRNPLFGMSSALDAMEARFRERGEYRRYTDVLRGQLERLNELMRGLLEYGRPLDPELAAGRLEEVLDEAARSCDALARERKVKIEVRTRSAPPPVAMDRGRLVQVFRNLVENAVQHSPPGATVGVELAGAAGDGTWATCAVSDQGPGLAAEDLEHLFEPFFSRRRGGTGLGLSIVQRIVEAHGGSVRALNRPGGGAELSVRLPGVSG